MFVTNTTSSPELGSPIVSVSTFNPHARPEDLDEQLERFSETSSIELIIQGGNYEPPTVASPFKVPESHTLNFNHYPGSKKAGQVPVDILKSFAPLPTATEPRQPDGADIYSDYVQDPYNLTLQIDGNTTEVGVDGVRNESVPSASTIFQSSSYFSSDANESLPPGSELFNRP